MAKFDKATLFIAVAGLFIAALVFLFGDNLLKRFSEPSIHLRNSTISLDGLSTTKDSVSSLDFYNIGRAPATNIKIIAKFTNADIKFKVDSDEEIKTSLQKDQIIEISLERLSPRAHVRIFVYSKGTNPLLHSYYVDNTGKFEISSEEQSMVSTVSVIQILSALIIIALAFFILKIIIKLSERSLLAALSAHAVDVADKLGEIKSDIADLNANEEHKKNNDEDAEEKAASARLRKLISG